jgi:glyoxylase-like metal-dependent hydrolase (beta-lactamase superfamily II)
MERSRVAVLLVALAVPTDTAFAQDAKAVLQAVSTAMGADNVKTLEITGTGIRSVFGQSYTSEEVQDWDWPRFLITRYTRTFDFDAKFSSEDITFRPATDAELARLPKEFGRLRGGPLVEGEQRLVQTVNGAYAWNTQGTNAVAMPAEAEARQLQILLTPIGFLKAAMAGNPTAISWTPGGKKLTIVSFMALGKYRVLAEIDDQNRIETIRTKIPNPVYGDMVIETRHTNYRDFGGLKYPTQLHSHQGDERLNAGHNVGDVRVENVQVNPTVAVTAVPENVRTATIPPVRVESQKLADGVWFLGGGSHNSMAVEFRDFITVVEAPLSEERSVAVIDEVHRLIPKKPIRYVVNTHHHYDHSGGLRTYVAEGATVVTHEANRDFYREVLFYPGQRTLQPDRLSLDPLHDNLKVPKFATLAHHEPAGDWTQDKYVISDGTRTMDIYTIQGLSHAVAMLIAYLPKEKIVLNADLYSPPAQGASPPATPPPNMVTFANNLRRLGLDVAQHVPIHGRVGTNDEFVKIMGRPSN